ncbi:MAG TPA: hypothetical protein VGW40_10490 [Allosphingosinicella sp.]|nr:hypothetical protein [Allosphingosinicella sp.]
MAIYLVTWDLNQEKPNYSKARAAFLERLDKFENRADSGLDSVRFVSTTWDASKIRDYLRKAQDDNDTLFVTRIHKGSAERNGWVNKTTWEWIRARE